MPSPATALQYSGTQGIAVHILLLYSTVLYLDTYRIGYLQAINRWCMWYGLFGSARQDAEEGGEMSDVGQVTTGTPSAQSCDLVHLSHLVHHRLW